MACCFSLFSFLSISISSFSRNISLFFSFSFSVSSLMFLLSSSLRLTKSMSNAAKCSLSMENDFSLGDFLLEFPLYLRLVLIFLSPCC